MLNLAKVARNFYFCIGIGRTVGIKNSLQIGTRGVIGTFEPFSVISSTPIFVLVRAVCAMVRTFLEKLDKIN